MSAARRARRAGFGFTVAGHTFGVVSGLVGLAGVGAVWWIAGGRASDFPALLDTLQQGAPLTSWHWQPAAAAFAGTLAAMIGDGFDAASRWALRRPVATAPGRCDDVEDDAPGHGSGTAARWIVTEYDESGAWLGQYDGQTELDGAEATDACRAAAAVYALWWEPTWIGVRHHRVEVVTAAGAYGVVCAARRLIRPIESLQEAEWSVDLVDDVGHDHEARPMARPDLFDNGGLTAAYTATMTDGGWLPIVRVEDFRRWNEQFHNGDER